jgi:hypothetical protein
MKPIAFHVIHRETGERLRWTLRRETGVYWIRAGRKPKKIDAWMLTDHEGYQRYLESNWLDSVPLVHRHADNHGCDCFIS